jgi:hypothetical protein
LTLPAKREVIFLNFRCESDIRVDNCDTPLGIDVALAENDVIVTPALSDARNWREAANGVVKL